jgi:ABC-type oligopeptide transport system ATPase subunit
MKKKTPQNPETEQMEVQEENAAIAGAATDQTNDMLPTDSDQTEEPIMTAEEIPEITEVIEDKVTETVEMPDEPQPAEPVMETGETLPEEIAEHPVETEPGQLIEEVAQETAAEIIQEPAEEVAQEPVEEVALEPVVESAVEPIEEISGEHIDLLLDEHLDEVTEENVEHVQVEGVVDFDGYTREQLVDLLEKAVNETDFNAVKSRIALIKVAFLKKKKEENLQKYDQVMEEGGTKEELAARDEDELDVKFNEFFAIYRANKARHTEEQEKIKQENLRKKFLILDALKALISSEETLKKTYDEFKNLQERWKEIGMVPRTEINNLWQNYHFLVEKFFEKVKLNKELKDLDLRKNMEAKIALCEKTEELLLETSVIKSFKKLQKYHEEWKELGPVPADKKDEIWERFKNATDKINDRRREHYSLVEEDQHKNLETKNALCEQAEIVVGLSNDSIKDWQENTNKVNDLLKIWKNIGPVPQKVNSEIWNRFKTSLDAFFANKKEYFDKLKEQQMHNYNLKVELCMQAESLNTSTDWKNTTNELIRLQGEWKKIGPVPKKHSDRIWKRFRTACDEFFNAKQAYFSNIQASEGENLTRKLDLMNRLKEYQFGDNKSANLDVLKNFQREWTEIGHVPMKEKDKLHNEFRTLVNEQLDKLKISEVEMSTMSFQAKFDHLKNDPNARRVIGKEREFLATKISRMKEEIILWENNIGFFAKSKSASIVKEEFENKINKAKSELKVLEAKMKILKQQGN